MGDPKDINPFYSERSDQYYDAAYQDLESEWPINQSPVLDEQTKTAEFQKGAKGVAGCPGTAFSAVGKGCLKVGEYVGRRLAITLGGLLFIPGYIAYGVTFAVSSIFYLQVVWFSAV